MCIYIYICVRTVISYKTEKEIAQGRPIDIDDVKTEKCGINYFCDSRFSVRNYFCDSRFSVRDFN